MLQLICDSAARHQDLLALSELSSTAHRTSAMTQSSMDFSLLTRTDSARLNMARSLVLNPEILVMHMPCISFTDDETEIIIKLLKDHIDRRGLGMGKGMLYRRPRTIFMSISSLRRCGQADEVWLLDNSQSEPLRKLS